MITRKRLFFDIETSFNIGLFWRAGYKQRIGPEQIIHERKVICISYKWEGEDKVHNLRWDENQDDKKMLKAFIKIMNKADEIIAHNGDKFDIKWLRTRCFYHRISMFPSYKSLDTLKAARKYFNFNSNKLDYIAKFAKVGEKMETGGLQLWIDVILHKDPEALQKMVDYCDQDVIVLESVFNELNNYIENKTNYAIRAGAEKFCCPECASCNSKVSTTNVTTKGVVSKVMKCKDCGKYYKLSIRNYMNLLEFKIKYGIK